MLIIHRIHQLTVNIDLTLTTPANAKGPVPVIMEFGFVFPPGFRFRLLPPEHRRKKLAAAIIGKRMGLCHFDSHKLPGR